VPCNQFGDQEPGTNAEIFEFATSTYDVNFPMFAKTDVNGETESPLYTHLKAGQPGDIGWNFEKFLVDPAGTVVARWGTGDTPEDIGAALPDLMS